MRLLARSCARSIARSLARALDHSCSTNPPKGMGEVEGGSYCAAQVIMPYLDYVCRTSLLDTLRMRHIFVTVQTIILGVCGLYYIQLLVCPGQINRVADGWP